MRKYPKAKSLADDIAFLDDYVERLIRSKDKKSSGSTGGERYSFAFNDNVDNKSGKDYNISRANKQGELVNEFYNALDKNEWKSYYNNIADNGYLEITGVGEKIVQIIGNKLVVSQRQYTGQNAHDFQMINAFEFDENIKETIDEFSNLLRKEGINLDGRRIQERLFSFVSLYGEERNVRYFTKHGSWANISDKTERNSISSIKRNAEVYGKRTGRNSYVSSSQRDIQQIPAEIEQILFDEEFDKAINNDEYYKNNAVVVGNIPNLFLKYGFDTAKPLTVTPKHLKDITHQKVKGVKKYHGLSKKNIINAVEQLENPAVLIQSPSNPDVLIAFTTETDSDGIPIAIYISKTGKAYINAIETETNHILSIYGRDNTINFINAAIKDNRILDGDKKRADKLQNILGIMLSLPDNILSINSTSSIRQTEQKSQEKFSDEEFSSGMLEQLRYNPEEYTKRLLKRYGIKVTEDNVNDIADKIREVTRLYNKGKNSRGDYDIALKELSMEIAESIPDTVTDSSQEIINYIKKQKVSLSDTQRAEIAKRYGSVKEYLKLTGLKTAENAMSLDSLWGELAETYPGYFSEDITEADEISRIADIK